MGNPKPKFLIKNCLITNLRLVGEKHYTFLATDTFGNKLKAISFNSLGNPLGDIIETKSEVKSIIVSLLLNAWAGEEKVELLIEDITV